MLTKTLRVALWLLLALLVVVALLVTYVATSFDPNRYKPQLERWFLQNKQRELRIDGSLSLSWFPNVAIQVGRAQLAERNSKTEFASLDGVRISLALRPLLGKRLVVNALHVDGLLLNLRRNADGSNNFDDLLASDRPSAWTFDIAKVEVSGGHVTLDDRKVGINVVLSDLQLRTGAVAEGRPGNLQATFALKGVSPRLDGKTKLGAGYRFSTKPSGVSVSLSEFDYRGSIGNERNVVLNSRGELVWGGAQSLILTDLVLKGSSEQAQRTLTLDASAPRFILRGEDLSADPIKIAARTLADNFSLEAEFSTQALSGSLQELSTPGVSLRLTTKQDKTLSTVTLTGPVSTNVNEQKLTSSAMRLSLDGRYGDALVKAQMLTPATIDLAALEWTASDAAIDVDAKRIGTELQGQLRGAFTGSLKEPKFRGENFAFNAIGKLGDKQVRLQGLAATQISLADELSIFDTRTLELAVDGAEFKLRALTSQPLQLELKGDTLRAENILASLRGSSNTGPLDGTLRGSLVGNLARQSWQLNTATLQLRVGERRTLLAGALVVDQDTLKWRGRATVDGARIDGELGLHDFANPRYVMQLSIDQLDLDRYLGQARAKTSERKKSPGPTKAGTSGMLQTLRELRMDAQVRIGKLRYQTYAASNIRLALGPGRISVAGDELNSAELRARGIVAELVLAKSTGKLELKAAQLERGARRYRELRLVCPTLMSKAATLECSNGKFVSAGQETPLSFNISEQPLRAEVVAKPSANEQWTLSAQPNGTGWRGTARLSNAQLSRVAAWLPSGQPVPNQGAANGEMSFTAQAVNADLQVAGLAFADSAGLRAGENLAARLRLEAKRVSGNAWQWNSEINWDKGEVFWAPYYIPRGGHRLIANGTMDGSALQLRESNLNVAGVGAFALSGSYDLRQRALKQVALRGQNLNLGELYPQLLKPLIEKPDGAQFSVAGRADVSLRYANDALTALELTLHETSLADSNQRFALRGVNASIPWVNAGRREAVVRIASGELWRVPLRNVMARAQMNGFDIQVPRLTVDVLDGVFALQDLRARRGKSGWQWEFIGALTPVSLPKLSETLKWPKMLGSLSTVIPRVSYANDEIKLDGTLLFNIFDGTIAAQDVAIRSPLGNAPQVKGGVVMRNLDLDLLTRTYSFGSMTGRIDVDVTNLLLQNWRPVQFDARVWSSAGDYPRKISQQAVQNISSLGGGGAGAAIQRSLLRMFEQFRYRQIGVTCKLRNGVCEMGGVSDQPRGYVIVQGGGIPSITVLGYNRRVGWDELISRIARVTNQNVKAEVR